ncbi:MAG: hypothetical protein ACREBR_01285 [bacterium]
MDKCRKTKKASDAPLLECIVEGCSNVIHNECFAALKASHEDSAHVDTVVCGKRCINAVTDPYDFRICSKGGKPVCQSPLSVYSKAVAIVAFVACAIPGCI